MKTIKRGDSVTWQRSTWIVKKVDVSFLFLVRPNDPSITIMVRHREVTPGAWE